MELIGPKERIDICHVVHFHIVREVWMPSHHMLRNSCPELVPGSFDIDS